MWTWTVLISGITVNMMYDIEITVGLGNNKITRTYKVEDPYEQLDSNKELSSMADNLSNERNLEI